MRFLVDLDGVICEYDFKSLFRKYFGVNLPNDGIYAYDLADVAGVAPEEINDMFYKQVHGEPHFIEGAVETLREWNDNNLIFIFSNRIKYMGAAGLVEWLLKYEIPFVGIDLKGNGEYDFYIDDSPAKLATINSKVKLLYSQEWNKRCLDIKHQFTRVNSWDEIRRIVNERRKIIGI
jgi:uncharacterized HAD superfamily protein